MKSDLGRRRCLPIAHTLAAAMVSASAGTPAHGQIAPRSCGVPAAETRWFDGRRLVVYDRLRVASFDPSGDHGWSARRPATTFREGVRFVTPVDEEEVIFGVDSLDFTSRRLQLWRVGRTDPHHHELLWERPVPWRSGNDPFPFLRTREAASRWARYRDCVVVSDGGRRFLWVVDLSTLETDSVPLPDWEVPAFGEAAIDRGAMNFGGREVQRESRGPALLSRWRGLIVDPDGHAWLRAWTEARDEFEVIVVSLASGQSRRLVNPPGFPTAFGPPGVFYTALTRPETDEQYLVRLEGATPQ